MMDTAVLRSSKPSSYSAEPCRAAYFDCEQGTDEWLALRLGVVTASNFGRVLTRGQGVTRKSYLMQLASEHLTQQPTKIVTSEAMRWGTENEAQARTAYEFHKGTEVCESGFFLLDCNAGCSPDGLIGTDGLLEIKCPNTATHLEAVLSRGMPSKYKAQVQGQLWVTGRSWCDFVSYDPRIRTAADFFCIRVYRDEAYIEELEASIYSFNQELESVLERLRFS